MASLMNPATVGRLERSCGTSACGWIRTAPPCRGLERIDAFFCGHAFDPHRHDTYAVGFTLAGVQSFRYRGASQHSLPGQVFVLHPDETHDGAAGTPAGFRYRIAYVEPALVFDALRAPLPFVRESVSSNRRLAAVLQSALADLDTPLEELQRDQIIVELADALSACDPSVRRKTISARHWRAVGRARDLLDGSHCHGVRSTELEALTGLTRYDLARHFRACLGTSPYRYLVMRRLDRVRALIQQARPLAEAALAGGFADQSHMTRHFKKAYGMSPGRWATISGSRAAGAPAAPARR